MKKVRWGILSTAKIGRTQLIPAMKRASNAEVVAIASRGEKVKSVARELSIPKAYESYEQLLEDPDVDVVYIPLPNHLHKEWVMKAAKAGKHILCEKPVALTAEDAKEIVTVCKENNVLFMEAFMYQFHPQHQRVRDIIASGEIGEVRLMRASFSFFLKDREENIRMDLKKGGGSLYDVGCYCIHSIRNILQSEPETVHVTGETDREKGVDISAFGYMKMENGVSAIFDSSFDMNYRNQYEVIGTKGTIIVPRAYRPDTEGGEGLIIIEKENEQRVERVYGDQYALEVEHFSECVLKGEQPVYSGDNTIRNMMVIDACYKSLRLNKKIIL